jgi:hypothetical protein
MVKTKQCGATTKKGVQCKNPGIPATSGLCYVHSKGLKKVNNLPATKPPRPTIEKIKTGAAIFGGVFSGTAGLIKVVGWVMEHWPQIEQTFRIIMPDGRLMYYRDVREYMQHRNRPPYWFIDGFERWYRDLPGYIKGDVQREFGDVRRMIDSARNEVKNL